MEFEIRVNRAKFRWVSGKLVCTDDKLMKEFITLLSIHIPIRDDVVY